MFQPRLYQNPARAQHRRTSEGVIIANRFWADLRYNTRGRCKHVPVCGTKMRAGNRIDVLKGVFCRKMECLSGIVGLESGLLVCHLDQVRVHVGQMTSKIG
jgi:hypothetical protein